MQALALLLAALGSTLAQSDPRVTGSTEVQAVAAQVRAFQMIPPGLLSTRAWQYVREPLILVSGGVPYVLDRGSWTQYTTSRQFRQAFDALGVVTERDMTERAAVERLEVGQIDANTVAVRYDFVVRPLGDKPGARYPVAGVMVRDGGRWLFAVYAVQPPSGLNLPQMMADAALRPSGPRGAGFGGATGAPADGEAAIRRMVDALQRHDANAFAQDVADGVVVRAPGLPGPVTGKGRAREFVQSLLESIPDVTAAGLRTFTGESGAVGYFTLIGTYSKALPSSGGPKATGQPIRLPVMLMVHMSGGKVDVLDVLWDATALGRTQGL